MTEKDEHGDIWHAFGCYGSIYVEDEDGEESPDISNWFEELSKIVREGDAAGDSRFPQLKAFGAGLGPARAFSER